MRFKLFFFVLLCLTLSACGKLSNQTFDYQTLDGDNGRFEDLRGRWLLINYWADWCVPCIKEMPALAQFAQQYSQQATVLAVNFDGLADDKLRAAATKLQIKIPLLRADPFQRLGYQRPEALPSTFVFGPDGTLKQVLQGEQTVTSLAAAIGAH